MGHTVVKLVILVQTYIMGNDVAFDLLYIVSYFNRTERYVLVRYLIADTISIIVMASRHINQQVLRIVTLILIPFSNQFKGITQ